MIFQVLLFLVFVAFVIFIIYNPNNASYRESYSYDQVYEPEDEARIASDVGGCGCKSFEEDNQTLTFGCGDALSKFEIPHYMRGTMCRTGPSNTFPGDPGYFLGRSVI